MAQYVNTNISSLTAQKNLNASQSALQTSMSRLSSGMRINTAQDDAAGYAIATRLTSQINGIGQATLNANDAISLTQTADSGMSSIAGNLQKMRTLAVQSSNSTYTASDRASMNDEVQQLKAEIDRVAGGTNFNGLKLLDGSFNSQSFQVGASNTTNDTIQVNSISSMTTDALGGVGTSAQTTVHGVKPTLGLTAGDLTLNGIQVGASELGAEAGQSTASAFSIATAINLANTGVTATADKNTVEGTAATTGNFTAIAADTFSINGINVGAVAAGGNAAGQGANLAAAINKVATQTGVSASANATTGAVTLAATDGRDINIGMNGTAADSTAATTARTTLSAQTGFSTTNIGLQAYDTGAPGVAAATKVDGTAAVSSVQVLALGAPTDFATAITAGNLKINGQSIGGVTTAGVTDAAGWGKKLATAINTASIANLTASADATTGAITLKYTGVGNVTVEATAEGNPANATAAEDSVIAMTGFSRGQLQSGGGVVGFDDGVAAPTASTVSGAQTLTTRNQVTLNAPSTTNTIAAGTFSINGTAIGVVTAGADVAGQAKNLALAINNAAISGVTASVDSVTNKVTLISATDLTITMNGTAADAATATNNRATLRTDTGFSLAQLGIQASNASGGITTADNAENHGSISLNSTSSSGIIIGGASVINSGLQGSIGQNGPTTTSSISAVAAVDISTQSGAQNALSAIDGAISMVNKNQGLIGALQNRFNSAVSNLQATSTNLSAARSRIQDTDFASETASMTRAQVLQQAGMAILGQANQAPNQVMGLLR